MVEYEDECCGCATENYPCLGYSCKNRHVPHFYCDECKEETRIYEFDDKQLCIDCIEKQLVIVGGDE